ncbi:MAG: biotin-dependent carboxyltransferase family protein [Anaerolineaceae bacterium]|nr:biotin-dependent carboxyltransferase family protein [Anaerolineaceae bacterium]
MTFKVIEPGFLATVQDIGRTGYQRFGMPVSGGMDSYALAAANLLVDNKVNTAALEFNASGLTLVTNQDCLIAVSGYGIKLFVEQQEFQSWMSIFVREGCRIHIEKTEQGTWGYLAVAGGFTTQPMLGSYSTYLRGSLGGFEGRSLQKDDELSVGIPNIDLATGAGRKFPPDKRPSYCASPTLRVILGPQADMFTQKGIQTFLSSDYTITENADRMGYRLIGNIIAHKDKADIISDGIVTGSIQVPANGQPIIMMADHQTTGGYAKIAAVIRADLPLLAQTPPGHRIRFCAVSTKTASVVFRAMMKDLLKNYWSQHEIFIDNVQA